MSTSTRARYEHLLVNLHREMRTGRGEGEHAEELRAEMNVLWYELADDEQALFDELSEDLYIIEGKRRVVSLSEGETEQLISQRVSTVFWSDDDRQTLSLIRKLPSIDARSTYAMARCWKRLGFSLAAVSFYDFANELEPKDSYEYMALDALISAGLIRDAIERVRAIESRPIVSGALLSKVAVILYRVTYGVEKAERRGIWEHVTELMESVWDDPTALPSVRAAGLVVAGFAYEHLGNEERALQSFDRAVAVHSSEAPLLARGLALLHTDRARAMRDFTRAVQMRTRLDWPYLYAAHHALNAGRYAEAERICMDGLSFAQRGEVRGRLYEWWAIAAAQLGRPLPEVNALFEQAMAELPLDPVLRRNVRLYQESIAAEQPPPKDAWELPAQVVDENEARKSLPLPLAA